MSSDDEEEWSDDESISWGIVSPRDLTWSPAEKSYKDYIARIENIVASDPTDDGETMTLSVTARLVSTFSGLEQDAADQVLAALKQAPIEQVWDFDAFMSPFAMMYKDDEAIAAYIARLTEFCVALGSHRDNHDRRL
jgi:hypothetical protein